LHPGIGLQGLDRQRNAPGINPDDFRAHPLADFEKLIGVLDQRPVKFREVREPFQTLFQFYENPEIHHSRHLAFNLAAHLILAGQLPQLFRFRPFLRKNYLALLGLNRNHGHVQIFADEFFELFQNFILVPALHARIVGNFQLGGRQKALDFLPFQNEPPFIRVQNRKRQRFFFARQLFRFFPNEVFAGLLQGKLHAAVLAFNLNDLRRHLVAGLQIPDNLARGQKFPAEDDARARRTEVNENFRAFASDDLSFHQIPGARQKHRDSFQKLLHEIALSLQTYFRFGHGMKYTRARPERQPP